MHADIPAWQSEGIDSVVVNDKESKVVITVIGLGGDFAADFVDVFVDQRVFYNLTAVADVSHDGSTNLRFLIRVENRISRAAHVGELDFICAGPADEHDRRECKGQQGRF